MNKIGYVRVQSKDESVHRQLEIMKSYGVDRIYTDYVSGLTMSRPELKAMIDDLQEGDTLYVVSIDRLGYATNALLKLVDEITAKGVNIIIHEPMLECTTPEGKSALKWAIVLQSKKK